MKRLLLTTAMAAMAIAYAAAQETSLHSFATAFRAKTLGRLVTIGMTDQYACLSDDGKRIVQYSFKDGKQTAILFDADDTTGEKLGRVDGFVMSPDGGRMLLQTQTEQIYRHSFKAEFYIYTMRSHKVERLSEGGKQQVPTFSPDGNQIAFVRDNNLFLVKLLYDNAEVQVTKDGKKNWIINGIPDWVNEEEFGFNTAYCFNADGSMLCWLKYDESAVKTYSLQLFKGLEPEKEENADYPGLYSYKYPKAGQENSKVSAWSCDIKSHRIQQLQVPLDSDGYMPRILPTKDSDRIVVLTLNRHQDDLGIYSVSPSTTLAQLLIQDKASCYVPEAAVGTVRIYGSAIVTLSDRDGYNHLYIYNGNGQQLRKIGADGETITAFYGYDESTGDVFYQSALLAPYDRQVFVAHKNGKTERLTQQEGWNSATFSGDLKYFANTWSNMNTPYVVTLRNAQGKVLATPIDNAEMAAKATQNQWNRREMFSFTTSEGVKLNGWILKPKNFNASKKYPVVMFQYSGPGSQQVVDSWSCGSMGQYYDYYLSELGYVVACVDGRGTGGRGAQFEKQTYQRLGTLEAKDQVETALWLGQQSYVDKQAIGIWGWSYGGFNTLMSMSEGRPVFRCGVAVAPPTQWKFYDSIYTERFMRTPEENPQGYGDGPISRAGNLSGALLLCHGLADDNVHPQNTFEYSEALVQADKDFRELIYTNRNHSIFGGNTRDHLMRQITDWFGQHLK